MNAASGDQERRFLAGKLLGEIELRLPYRTPPGGALPIGEVVSLRRGAGYEIRLETTQHRTLGRLPRDVCRWLVPLVDQGVVWLEAYVKRFVRATAQQRQHLVVLASVYLHRSRLDLLAAKPASNPQHTLHQLVLATYQQLPHCREAVEVRKLHASLLRTVGNHELLPETHLLLALFPRVADELEVARRMMVLGELSEYLATLEIKSPRQAGPLTMFPLYAPQAPSKEYLLFHHEHVKTAIVEQDDMALVEVVNERPGPLLTLPGEVFCTSRGPRALATATLVPPRNAHQLPATQLEIQSPHEASNEEKCRKPIPLLRGAALAAIIRLLKATDDEGTHAAERAQASRHVAQLCERLQSRRTVIDQLQQELQPPADAVGAVLLRGEQLVGLELCATPAMLQSLWPRVILSYAAETFALDGPSKPASQRTARRWVSEAGDSLRATSEQTGWGDSFVLHHDSLAGTALVDRAQLCHFTAFGVLPKKN